MVYKLVRCDSVDPCKIQLPQGIHLIGRGKFLECDDKRVSRNHGELQVTEDSVIIKALHQNPCFYLKKGTSETQILRNNDTRSLANGDRFGLLPDTHWYELLLCNVPDVTRSPEVNTEDNSVLGNVPDVNRPPEVNTEDNSVEGSNLESSVVDKVSDRTILELDNVSHFENESSKELNTNATKSTHDDLNDDASDEQPDSPSLLPTENQSSTQDYKIDDIQPAVSSSEQPEGTKSPSKRSYEEDMSNGPDESKKIKVEPDIKIEPDIKQEPEDVKPGPSNNQVKSSEDSGNNVDGAPPQPAKPPNHVTLRERCMYGGNCYRRNPQHKAQFSHPTDPDWGPGERGACPWGATCGRRDPRHWRDHEHPPGAQPPQNRPAGKAKKRKKSRETSPEPNLVVTGKRARKTIKRPSWSGSESENEYDMEDPFLTDGSDEWEPPSDIEESQDCTPDTLDY